jgi:hypothetical protein
VGAGAGTPRLGSDGPGPRNDPAAGAPRRYDSEMLLVAVRDLVFRSKIHAASERLGVPVRFAPRGTPLADAAREAGGGTVLADLSEPGVLEGVRAAKLAGARVVGFLGHLQEDLMRQAADAGVDEVLTRGEMVRRLDEILRAG